ncbi:MAG: hypothetical protein C0392_01980 [Syntrophus sp. (in: bacteria)]|nr:hypothetical protein [Syntrophus sp. (in: bacteria)]
MDLNQLPINLKAREMLAETGTSFEPASLYIVQLALWALDNNKIEGENDILETLKAMMTWRPERIMNFLMMREDEEGYEPVGWREAKTPLELAFVVLEDLEKKMVKHFPWYRCFE